ncbi:hypothetical protein WR25_24786 isoform A [Diploscapter pachys]|uniref:Glycosyltransferase family 92 protein n=1 Tax=Diploscapter pachys TaxID=2018661 RepID=A0A2A2KK12_9BILA|nr:hypothetical protein WR25_24786 isoform A [Diploscapter pachys]
MKELVIGFALLVAGCLLLFQLVDDSVLSGIFSLSSTQVTKADRLSVIYINNNCTKHNVTTNELPYHDLHMKWMAEEVTKENYAKANISLEAAYEYVDQIAIQITSQNLFGEKVYCHYFDSNKKKIGEPFESNVFPESVIYCLRRAGTNYVSLTKKPNDTPEYPIPLLDRTMEKPEHYFSVCIAPFFGTEPKWLMIAEFVEWYKLQGATYFYFYLAEMSLYDRIILDDYVRTGEAEVVIMHDRFDRPGDRWHMLEIHDCILRSRAHSKWAAFVDIDERLTMTQYKGTILDYLKNIGDKSIGSIQYRQRWIMKTEDQPEKYINATETVKWMTTQRYTNTSHVGPPGHTAKCIVRPETIGAMFIHYPRKFNPGFNQYGLTPEEGVVRHYRDQRFDNWGKTWIKEVAAFGPFEDTKLEENVSKQLVETVVKRVKYVYGKAQNGYK